MNLLLLLFLTASANAQVVRYTPASATSAFPDIVDSNGISLGSTVTIQNSSLTVKGNVAIFSAGVATYGNLRIQGTDGAPIVSMNDNSGNRMAFFGCGDSSNNTCEFYGSNGPRAMALALGANQGTSILINTENSVLLPSGSPLTVKSSSTFSTATSPSASFSPLLSSFTVTGALSGTFTTTTLGPCIAGSTISLTAQVSNSAFSVSFNGGISDTGLANVVAEGILLDGAFVNGETASKGLTAYTEQVANDINDTSFVTLLTGLSAAQHTVCFTVLTSAGTGTIDSTNSVAKLSMWNMP